MNTNNYLKSRFAWLLIIALISFGLVSAALAAASHADRVINIPAQDVSRPQSSTAQLQSIPPMPMTSAPVFPDEHGLGVSLNDEMLAKVMTAALEKAQSSPNGTRFFAADGQVDPVAVAMMPSETGVSFIPGSIVVDTFLDRIYGYTTPYAEILIIRSDEAYGAAQADQIGYFWTSLFDGDGGGTPVDILPGDDLQIEVNGSPSDFMVGEEPQGYLDVVDDNMSGFIPDDTGSTLITITLGLYGQPSDAYDLYVTSTDASGIFYQDFGFDLGPENFAVIDYMVGENYQRSYIFPQNVFQIMQHGMIAGYAPRFNNIHATVYVGDTGEVRWEGDAWADYPYGWFTFYGVLLDIGDLVVVDFPGGNTEMHYVYSSYFTFSGDDTVSGNISVVNQEVRVSFLEWDGTRYWYHETHAMADDYGNFTATFPEGGIRPDTRVDIAVMDDSGSGSYMKTGQPFVETMIAPDYGLYCVWGRVDKPNADMTLELERDGQIYPRDPSRPIVSDPGNMAADGYYCYAVWYDFGNGLEGIQFEAGDILRLKTDTWSGEVTIHEIHWSADAALNQVTGEILSGPADGEIAFGAYQSDNRFFSQGTASEARAPVINGTFLVPFGFFDIRSGVAMNLYVYDPATGFAEQMQEQNHYFQTIGNLAVSGHTYIPDEGVQLRLLEEGTYIPIYTTTNDIDGNPYSFYFDFTGCDPVCAPDPPLQPGYLVEVSYQYSGEADFGLLYETITAGGDTVTDIAFGNGKNGAIELSVVNDSIYFDQIVPGIDQYALMNTAFYGYDLGWGDSVNMTYRDMLGNYQYTSSLLGEIRRVEFWKNPDGMVSIWGVAQPGREVIIETSEGDSLTCWADPQFGNFGTDHATLLQAGDLITVTAGDGVYPVTITFPDYSADSDSTLDTVSGHIGLPYWNVEIWPWWGVDMQNALTDAEGNFEASYADIPPNGRGYIRFVEEFGPTGVDAVFHQPFYDLQPTIRVNYAHDWVEGQYDAGYQVWITVTNETGDIRATGHGVTGNPGWSGDTGFATWSNLFTWDELYPDIQVWDKVYVTLSNERTADVELGEITGELNAGADIFVGILNVPWLTDTVWVDCGVWVNEGPGMGMEVDPNGGSIICDFSGIYDILPGMDVGVGYYEPDNDQVINVFRSPAPDLRINTWGEGMPAYGNNYILEVHYNNDGWLTAPGVTIQQSYQGLTYISDTSGFSHTGTGDPADPIIWEVGELPYNHMSEQMFYVFVQVDELPGNSVTASSEIHSTMDYYQDEGRLYASWESEVADNSDSDLGIGISVWTWAPAPGQDYVYELNVCNPDVGSSTQVYVTDTLPLSTTLVSWWGREPGWEAIDEDPSRLVLSRPTISGNWCSQVAVIAHLSEQAEEGMNLHNEAVLWAASDPNPDDNFAAFDHPVGTPSYNLHLDPNWVSGQFVPSGYIGIEFGVSNWASMPMPGTLVTTTLPAGIEFIYAYSWDWNSWEVFTPTIITDEYLVWDLGTLLNGYSKGIGVQLKIADNVQPGTQLVFDNTVKGEELELRYDDNELTYQETVNEVGPNLRVDKHTNWGWNWEGQLYYELRILNLGTQYLENPIVTDTYPVSTTVNSCWWGHGPFTSCEVDEENHQVIFYLDYLNPGETASGMLSVDLAPEDIGVQGLTFTNQADISDFGDITPEDNHDEVSFVTGPDVFVHKWLKEGDLQSGELVTYTVEFGNYARWPWYTDPEVVSHITDTLPQGMTFVEAINYMDPSTPWEPESINGQQVVWGWGPMWADSTWTFDLVVQVGDPDEPELLNTIEAMGDNPNDIDVNPANNYFEYALYMKPDDFGKLAPDDGSIDQATSLILSWESSRRAEVYMFCIDTSDDDSCDGNWTDVGSDTSVDLVELDDATTYYWQVQASNLGGTMDADEGTWWSFTTIVSPPEAFGKLAPADGATDLPIDLTLSWEVSTGATSYAYCLDTTDNDTCDGAWTNVGTDTSVDLVGLDNATTYYWQVQASNLGGTTDADEGTWWSFAIETGISQIFMPVVQRVP